MRFLSNFENDNSISYFVVNFEKHLMDEFILRSKVSFKGHEENYHLIAPCKALHFEKILALWMLGFLAWKDFDPLNVCLLLEHLNLMMICYQIITSSKGLNIDPLFCYHQNWFCETLGYTVHHGGTSLKCSLSSLWVQCFLFLTFYFNENMSQKSKFSFLSNNEVFSKIYLASGNWEKFWLNSI